MTVQKFEDLIAWQKAQDLAVDIYKAFESEARMQTLADFYTSLLAL
jgi:hypothetical protein